MHSTSLRFTDRLLTCLVRTGVLLLQLVRLGRAVRRLLLVLAELHLGLGLDLGEDAGVQEVVVVVGRRWRQWRGRRERARGQRRLVAGAAQGSDRGDAELVVQLLLLVGEEKVLIVLEVEVVLLAEELVPVQNVELLPGGQLLPDQDYVGFSPQMNVYSIAEDMYNSRGLQEKCCYWVWL